MLEVVAPPISDIDSCSVVLGVVTVTLTSGKLVEKIDADKKSTPLSFLSFGGIVVGRHASSERAQSTDERSEVVLELREVLDERSDGAVDESEADVDVDVALSLRGLASCCCGEAKVMVGGSRNRRERDSDGVVSTEIDVAVDSIDEADPVLACPPHLLHLLHSVSLFSTPRSTLSQHPPLNPGCEVARMQPPSTSTGLP